MSYTHIACMIPYCHSAVYTHSLCGALQLWLQLVVIYCLLTTQ